MAEKEYTFPISFNIVGYGNTAEDAWKEALEAYIQEVIEHGFTWKRPKPIQIKRLG